MSKWSMLLFLASGLAFVGFLIAIFRTVARDSSVAMVMKVAGLIALALVMVGVGMTICVVAIAHPVEARVAFLILMGLTFAFVGYAHFIKTPQEYAKTRNR